MSEDLSQNNQHLLTSYNNSYITLLARDPYWLYAYWEINEHAASMQRNMGDELWEKSVPELKVTDVGTNKSFYVRINEFSNNWYINVPNSECLYRVEIGRNISDSSFISFAASNCAATPCDNISQDITAYFVNYTDLRSGRITPESGKLIRTHGIPFESDTMISLFYPDPVSGSWQQLSDYMSSPGIFSGEHEI